MSILIKKNSDIKTVDSPLDEINNKDLSLDNFLDNLNAIRKYQKELLTHGIERVDFYVEDTEGDWLENW